MITVPQATEKIIRRSRFLTEAMAKDLINASSLARYIHKEVEDIVMKPVTRGSIIMAIKRFHSTVKEKTPMEPFFQGAPDMIVRSNLTLLYLTNSPTLLKKLLQVETTSKDQQKKALFSYGRVETLILANKITTDALSSILQDENIVHKYSDVSAITIHTPKGAVEYPGILNLFIKSLAWENIAILGLLVTQTELTFVFHKSEIHTAFSIFQSLFSSVDS